MLSAVIRSALGYPAFTVGTITGTPELTYRFNGRTAQPLEHTTAPGGEEPTSRCQRKAQSQSQGTVKLHRVFLSRCRQCPDRYAFRAGRNLPDKEFRYLRTVIVTAAVHRGFGRRLPCHQVPSCSKSFELFLGVWHGLLQRRSAWYSNIGSRLAFATAPVGSLNQATAYESPAHSSTGTRSEPWLLPLLGSLRFHVLFHSPMGVLFTLPSRYYFAIGHPGVFSLARWSLLIHTGFHVPHATRVRENQERRAFPLSARLFGLKNAGFKNESLPFSDPDCPT
ncbi:unnamed protein product [Withania somnifera]